VGRFVGGTDRLMDYLSRYGAREDPALTHCREETAQMGQIAMMQIAPEQGAFLAMLVKLIGATRCLEVGVFTGYSALSVALAMPAEGRVVALDVSKDYTDKARVYWREAGVADKIDLRLGPGVDALDAMIAAKEGPFDFAFIDADKTNYANYYERALALIRPGGLIAIDNVLWDGKVVDPSVTDADTEAIRDFNSKLQSDTRVALSLIPLGDGLTLACKL